MTRWAQRKELDGRKRVTAPAHVWFALLLALATIAGTSCHSETGPSDIFGYTCADAPWAAWADFPAEPHLYQGAQIVVGSEFAMRLDYRYPDPAYKFNSRELGCDNQVTSVQWTVSDPAVVSIAFDAPLRAVLRATAPGQASVRAVLHVAGAQRQIALRKYVSDNGGGYIPIEYLVVVPQ